MAKHGPPRPSGILGGMPPRIRTDIVDVFVFHRLPAAPTARFLQMRRATEPARGSWQPVMGHIEGDETALHAACRELLEETGYGVERGIVDMWQLERVNTFFMASRDQIVMSPGFAVEVEPDVAPTLWC